MCMRESWPFLICRGFDLSACRAPLARGGGVHGFSALDICVELRSLAPVLYAAALAVTFAGAAGPGLLAQSGTQELKLTFPQNFKVRGFTTKYIAKKALSGRVPREILNRKKAGFPVPYEKWLREDLKDWVHSLLLDSRTTDRGYFQKNAVQQMLSDDMSSGGFSKEIFDLIVLELWHREFLEKRKPAFQPQPSPEPTCYSAAGTAA